ncbi:class II fumarate hydratase [Rhodobacteraceae bacterium CH30]|nr:class II fumarate hydratase [Rhodobacteraceae bacterium CH30]
MKSQRTEYDSMGPVEIADGRLWGAQTQRALAHFAIGETPMPHALLSAYARLKKACALANSELGQLTAAQSALICQVCDEILAGRHDAQFPLPPWISGSGTQFNMNVNEVIANRASELAGEAPGSHQPLHPNDHVNRSTSSNDTFPTAMHIAAALATHQHVLPALARLQHGCADKGREWNGLLKVGRTHLMDAVPMRMGQEWQAFASQLLAAHADISHALAGVMQLALGGTAVGSGLGAPPGFAQAAILHLANFTGLPFREADDHFAAQGAHDALARLSASLKTLAAILFKIASDVRLLASGPRCGLAELKLPDNEPGSSIMPGKVNPTQCEMLAMVALQIMANDQAVTLGNAGGMLQMNVYKPLIIRNLLESLRLAGDAMDSFNRHLVANCQADSARLARDVESTLMRVTALAPVIGYEQAARIAQLALTQDLPLRVAALQMGVEAALLDKLCDASAMAGTGRKTDPD